jgi:hypothetical protein
MTPRNDVISSTLASNPLLYVCFDVLVRNAD